MKTKDQTADIKERSKRFVDGIFCDCGDQMTVQEVEDNRCMECDRSLD